MPRATASALRFNPASSTPVPRPTQSAAAPPNSAAKIAEAHGVTPLLIGDALEGEAKANYLNAAREKTWARMKGLMAESPAGEGQYDALIGKFYDAARDQ